MSVEPRGGGVCAVEGVTAAGVAAGLRRSGRPDVALVDAGRPVVAAGVQTRNQVAAAPVQVTARHLADGRARAVVLNSGQANACTGAQGVAVAQDSTERVADALGCASDEVLVCSTGVIGVQLRRDVLLDGIDKAAAALSPDGGGAAAEAILTTDTVAKEAAVTVTDDRGGRATVGGMAKGSGMIAPGMATMLAVVTTDAAIDAATAQRLLVEATDRTFNRISVDGCMSTNDAVLLLATGTAEAPALDALAEGLEAVCAQLASAIVHDGEGAGHVAHLTVSGADSEAEALAVARQVADSVLVRTALAGEDPNWGRVLAAVGAGPVRVDPDLLSVRFGDVEVCRDGTAVPFDPSAAAAALAGTDVDIDVSLGRGPAQATVLFNDLTHEYVAINADYTT